MPWVQNKLRISSNLIYKIIALWKSM